MGIFAGTVMEKREVVAYNDSGDSVINLVVGVVKEVFGGIKTTARQTVVLFKGEAERADREIRVGDAVFFGDAVRSARVYETKNGQKREVVDIIANDFTKISKTQFEKSMPEIAKKMISEEELIFSEEDREAIAKQSCVNDLENDDFLL